MYIIICTVQIFNHFLFLSSGTYTVSDQAVPFQQHRDPSSILNQSFPGLTTFFTPEPHGLPNQPGFFVEVVVKLDHTDLGVILVSFKNFITCPCFYMSVKRFTDLLIYYSKISMFCPLFLLFTITSIYHLHLFLSYHHVQQVCQQETPLQLNRWLEFAIRHLRHRFEAEIPGRKWWTRSPSYLLWLIRRNLGKGIWNVRRFNFVALCSFFLLCLNFFLFST